MEDESIGHDVQNCLQHVHQQEHYGGILLQRKRRSVVTKGQRSEGIKGQGSEVTGMWQVRKPVLINQQGDFY